MVRQEELIQKEVKEMLDNVLVPAMVRRWLTEDQIEHPTPQPSSPSVSDVPPSKCASAENGEESHLR